MTTVDHSSGHNGIEAIVKVLFHAAIEFGSTHHGTDLWYMRICLLWNKCPLFFCTSSIGSPQRNPIRVGRQLYASYANFCLLLGRILFLCKHICIGMKIEHTPSFFAVGDHTCSTGVSSQKRFFGRHTLTKRKSNIRLTTFSHCIRSTFPLCLTEFAVRQDTAVVGRNDLCGRSQRMWTKGIFNTGIYEAC